LLGVVVVFWPVLASPEPPMSLAASGALPVVLGTVVMLWLPSVDLVVPGAVSWLVVEELSPP
jgi:hypothetical protein